MESSTYEKYTVYTVGCTQCGKFHAVEERDLAEKILQDMQSLDDLDHSHAGLRVNRDRAADVFPWA